MDLKEFSLIYFTADPHKASKAFNAGVDAILVDCENKGKEKRQANYMTEINYNQPSAIAEIRRLNPLGKIFCRTNAINIDGSADEIDAAIRCGADGIILPMVELREDIDKAQKIIDSRAKLIAMIETQAGYRNINEIIQSRFDAIYIGLNDFSISKNGAPLFEPLIDGTVENIIKKSKVPVGVGGVTDPMDGKPIKSLTLIREYQRLGVKFSVLRRSFEKSIESDSMQNVVNRIKQAYRDASLRSEEIIVNDKNLFILKAYGN